MVERNNQYRHFYFLHYSRGGSVNRKTEQISDIFKTETDTDFGILKTGKYRIPTKNNRKNRLLKPLSCLCFTIQ